MRVQAHVGEQVREFQAEALLIAVGREPVTRGFGLENRGAGDLRTGRVHPGGRLRPDRRPGDLRHRRRGRRWAGPRRVAPGDHCDGAHRRPEPGALRPGPGAAVVYTRPEVASVGLTEAQAREQGREVRVGTFPWRGIGKALVHGSVDGSAKIVADAATGDVLGVHLIGPDATNLIAEAGLALTLNASAWELGQVIHRAPDPRRDLRGGRPRGGGAPRSTCRRFSCRRPACRRWKAGDGPAVRSRAGGGFQVSEHRDGRGRAMKEATMARH